VISGLLDIKIEVRLEEVVNGTAEYAKTKSAKLGFYRKRNWAGWTIFSPLHFHYINRKHFCIPVR
jgi:hypothetical protein